MNRISSQRLHGPIEALFHTVHKWQRMSHKGLIGDYAIRPRHSSATKLKAIRSC